MPEAQPEPVFDVAQFAHIELYTPRMEESLWFFCDLLGMQETERADGSVYLRGYEESYHHSLKLTEGPQPGMAHCAWRTTSRAALERRVAAIEAAGLGEGWIDGDRGHGPAYVFHTPDGHKMELFWEVERVTVPPGQRTLLKNRPQRRPLQGVPVRRLDHLNVLSSNVGADDAFFRDVLGFRLREQLVLTEDVKQGVWLSVSPLPHEIAIMADPVGARARLHHVCFYYGTQQHLEDLVDVINDHDDRDVSVEIGPAVHGTTRAKFLYVREPGGNRIELFGDSGYLIFEPDFEPVTWGVEDIDVGGAWIGRVHFPDSFFLYAMPPVEDASLPVEVPEAVGEHA